MKLRLLVLLLLLSVSARAQKPVANPAFQKLKGQFLNDYFRSYPDAALGAGNHRYDSLLSIRDQKTYAAIRTMANGYLKRFAAVNKAGLSPVEQMELAMMRDEMNQLKFFIDTIKIWQWNPAFYNVTGRFSMILNNSALPLEKRMRNLTAALKHVPAFYAAAQANIKNPTREHTRLAILQHMGSLDIFQKELIDSGNKARMGFREMEALKARSKAAHQAASNYVSFLQGLKPEKWRSFRLGEPLYRKQFNHLLGLPIGPDQAYRLAQARKAEMHGRMYGLAGKGLWGKYFPKEDMPKDTLAAIRRLSDQISLNHTTRDSFQTAIAQQIPELEAFVRRTGIVGQDSTKPLEVRKEPEYMKGVAGASISAPGFYEPNGATYYNVGSLAGYTPEDAESFLREYNRYTMQILNIHEAVPGHYVQLIYANRTPSPILGIFENSALIEGWAVYSEQAMLEAGYGKDTPEVEFMYAKWHLRSVCNTILDISVHTRNMDSSSAMNLLTREAFQQDEEARGKWRRVQLTQVQLCSYFTGYSQIIACRERIKARMGDRFNVREFHDRILSYGSAPLKYIVPRVEASFQ